MTAWRIFCILTFLPLLLNGGARIDGRVINATRDSLAVSNILVALQKLTAGDAAPQPVGTQTTGRLGNFNFNVTEPDTADYFVTADYLGVRYFSNGLKLINGANDLQTVVVYDTTRSTAQVTALMHHILIDDLGESLQLRETRVLNNPTTKTIIAPSTASETEGIFRFPLPPGAVDFTPLSGPIGEDLIESGNAAVDRGVFIPGNKTVAYAYQLPLQKSQQTMFSIPHAARMFDLFVNSNSLRIESPQLTDLGEFTIRGLSYRRYGASNLPADSQVRVAFVRTGAARATSSSIILLLSGLLLVAGLASGLSRRRSPQPDEANRKALLQKKQDLMTQIAEIGSSNDSKRRTLFDELKKIELQLQLEKIGQKK